MSTPVEGGPRAAGSPPAVIDRRPFQTAMLALIKDEPHPAHTVREVGAKAVPWNEAVQAYEVKRTYDLVSATRKGRPEPTYDDEQIVRVHKGAQYMVGKYFDQMKSRGLIKVEDAPEKKVGDRLVSITDLGRERLAAPEDRPYMMAAGGRGGRTARGRTGRLFTDEQVVEIRKRWAAGEIPSEIAPDYGVEAPQIQGVMNDGNYDDVVRFERTPEAEEIAHQKRLEYQKQTRIDKGLMFSDDIVMEIRERWAAGAVPHDLATDYKIKRSTLQAILNGSSYTELPLPPRTPEGEELARQRTAALNSEARVDPDSDDVVMDVRRRWAMGEIPSELSAVFGINVTTLKKIINGSSYAHLPVLQRTPEAEAEATRRSNARTSRSKRGRYINRDISNRQAVDEVLDKFEDKTQRPSKGTE